jgi:hypothetical protein
MCSQTARCRATPDRTNRSAKAKAAERRSAAWQDPKTSQNSKLLMARPQYEARTWIQDYFDFFFAFFFFVAMTLSSLVCGGPSAGLVQVAGFDPLLICVPGPRPLTANENDISGVRTAIEKRK